MEHNRKQKLLMILALVLGITSLSIGFAAFSTTLNISSSASVTPNSDTFSVKFSTSQNSLVVGAVTPSSKTSGIITTDGVIDNSANPTIKRLSATFTSPGQYVEYTFYARNEGEYTAYLNNINYIGDKICTGEVGTTDSLVQSACDDISIKVTIGSITYNETTTISGHTLAKDIGEQIKVRLDYESNGTYVDGPFSITFPNIALVYSTIDDSTIHPSLPQSKVCTYVDSEDDTGSAIGTIDLSDEVTCGTESFYVISNENGKITMLSMYNLLVGNSVDESRNVTPLVNPTGLQDSNARGWVYKEYPLIGTTAFSYNTDGYSGSIVESYVNNYKTYLTNIGVNLIDARLITKEELEMLGCNHDGLDSILCAGTPEFVFSTSYWSGSQTDNHYPYYVSSSGVLTANYSDNDNSAGVRPVIEIDGSEINSD